MKIAEFSVKNYQFTIVIFIMVMALGINSLLNMPRGEDPPFNAPTFIVVSVYPGTSPNDMEELVADKIEEKILELSNLKRVRSEITDGLCVTRIEFKYGQNIDEKYNEVVREINALKQKLPPDILSIDVNKASSSDVNTYQIAFVSESASFRELYDEADRLKSDLEKIKDLKKIEIHGYPKQKVEVIVDLAKMSQMKVPLNRVLGAIQSENANIPAGSVDLGNKKFNVKTSGDYASLKEIENTVVFTSLEKIVYLKDIAQVRLGYEENNYLTRFNGKRAIFLTISEKERTNILKNRKDVLPVLDDFSKSLPSYIILEKGFDQSEDVSHRLGGFARDFTIAIVLVLLTLLPLGFRASIVVMISIPLSIAMGLAMLDMLNFTINQLSIVGLVVALGLLVDDSIVVVENIERFLREGYDRKTAAIEATKQIGLAVLGCTATLIFAFLPLLFLPEGSGDFIRSLPAAVVTTVLASLFVSMTIIPFLSSLILERHHSPEGNIFLRGLKSLIGGSYTKLLNKALNRPYLTLFVAFLIFIGSLALIPIVGMSVFPKSEKPMFLVNIKTPIGSSIEATNEVAIFVENELKKEQKLKSLFTNVGKGNPRVYYNIFPQNFAPNFAQIFVRLNEMTVPELQIIIDNLRNKFEKYPNAEIEVRQFEQGPPSEAPIAIRIFGENLDSLRILSTKVKEVIESTEGTIYTTNPLRSRVTDLKVDINKDKALMLGVPIHEIDRTVRLGIAGIEMGRYRDEKGEELKIMVSLPREKEYQTLQVFDYLYVPSQTGNLIPLNHLANLTLENSVPVINHYDKNRFITVTSFVKTGYNTRKVTENILNKLKEIPLSKGYRFVAAGEVETSQESFGGMGQIVTITIFGILAILLLEFKTFKSTLIVLSVIPLGIIGAVGILLLTGNTFSFVATVGLIALIGIEIKNSILLVDYTNYLRREGMGLDEAIQVAGETRFIPIVLTTLTAIGGLIPLVLEDAPLYSPLAWVLIGGLVSSTILTRIVTPVLYKLLAPKVEE
jgi:multidrug efflux pump subunit AcrB